MCEVENIREKKKIGEVPAERKKKDHSNV